MSSQKSPISEERRAEIETKIRHRVTLEKKAFELVKHLAITDSVTEEELVDIGRNISRQQYLDVTEERSIEKLCGYPLCSEPLKDIIRQKYKISLVNKTVYDLTERKKFCSNQCYEASKHFQSQISETPAWLREAETSVKITVLHRDENQKVFPRGRNGDIVFSSPWSNVSEMLKTVHLNDEQSSDKLKTVSNVKMEYVGDNPLHDRSSDSPSDGAGKMINNELENVKSSATTVNESDLRTGSTSDRSLAPKRLEIFERVDDTVRPDATALVEMGASRSDVDKIKTEQSKDDEVTRSTSSAVQRNSSIIEKLQFICEWKSHRTVCFFHSTASRNLSDYGQRVFQFYSSHSEAKENVSSAVCLAPVDHLSQISQRRRIVLEKLSRVWPKLETLLQLSFTDSSDDMKKLVYTFDFSSKNISFKPAEWIIVGYILLKILDEKKKCLYGRKMSLNPFGVSEEQVTKIVSFMTAYDEMGMVD